MKRRILSLALILAVAAGLLTVVSQPAASVVAAGASNISRMAAAEGMVLVQNDNAAAPLDPAGKLLPLRTTDKVAVFGTASGGDFRLTGGGSGDVTMPYRVDFQTGMNNKRNAGKLTQVTAGGNNPSQATVDSAAANNNVAIVVLSRGASEGGDIGAGDGGYLLTADQRTMLQRVNGAFDNVVVVMNIGNAVDMTFVENYPHIRAVLIAWFPGIEGGNAAADLLCGDINPSGKLADTFARSLSDFPSTATFGQQNPQYTEDIYVGYRYFVTADPNYAKVKYEFGYGLSYSTFTITDKTVTVQGDEIVATAKVTNMGPYAGKEVVQTYYAAPRGKLNKPACELAAFAKTEVLQPYQSQVVTMRFPIGDMASYDDVGMTGIKSAWVMEAGTYNIYMGNSIKNATWNRPSPDGTYIESDQRVTEQLSQQMTPPTAFNRLVDPVSGTYQMTNFTPSPAPVTGTPNPNPGPPPVIERENWPGGSATIMLSDVYEHRGYIYDFVAQMTDSELRAFGSAAADSYGLQGFIGKLPKYGIPEVITCDGPAGIRISSGATAFPIGTQLACMWNEPLLELVGAMVAAEANLNKVDIWLAPGMDIHRNPRNGRNFEYFSEDPLVSGKAAVAITRGVQNGGSLVTLKHYACNDQETNRYGGDSQVSERALREIHLKGFEIAVKESNPACIMAAYNSLNGALCATNRGLLTNILRNEWGYEGVVMTDWGNSIGNSADQIAAGCNLNMWGTNNLNVGVNITRANLEANVRTVVNVLLRANSFRQYISPDPTILSVEASPNHVNVGKAANITVAVTGRNLGGTVVRVGISGYASTYVTLPESATGGTVTLSIPAGLLNTPGTADIGVTIDGKTSPVGGTLRVDSADTRYVALKALRNGKIAGHDRSSFAGLGQSGPTMVANLDAPDYYSEFRLVPSGTTGCYFLQANNNRWLVIEDGNAVHARTAVGAGLPATSSWEAIYVVETGAGDGSFNLRSGGNRWVTVAADGTLGAQASNPGVDGRFVFVDVS